MLEVFTTIITAVLNIGFLPEIYLYAAFVLFVAFLIFKSGKLSLELLKNPLAWMYSCIGLFFVIQYPKLSDLSMSACFVLYCALPFLILVSGFELIDMNRERATVVFKRVIYAIVVGCAIHCLLNIFSNIGHDRWHLVDFFLGNRSATNSGALNTFIFALLPAMLMEKNWKVKFVGSICFAISLIYAFILGTRTQLYMLVIILVGSAILFIVTSEKGTITPKLIIKWIVSIVVVVVAVYFILNYDVMGVKTTIESSNLGYRYVDVETAKSDTYRLGLIVEGLESLIKYPLGGNPVDHYFHNYWLDVGRVGGVIPFILAVAITLINLFQMWKVFRNKKYENSVRFAVLGLYLGTYMNYGLEPIMDGFTHLIFRFLLVNGMVYALYRFGKTTQEPTESSAVPE